MSDTRSTGGTAGTPRTYDDRGHAFYSVNGKLLSTNEACAYLAAQGDPVSRSGLQQRFRDHGTIIYDPTLMGRVKADGTRSAKPTTPDGIKERKRLLYDIVEKFQPMTVRQAYYQAVVAGFMGKDEADYDKVGDALADMRLNGDMDWSWIVDNTRSVVEPWTFVDADDAREHARDSYTQSYWRDHDRYVEFWTEKDTNVADLLWEYQVPLIVAHGNSSVTAIHDAAKRLSKIEVPIYLYHIGDHDQFGRTAYEKIVEGIARDVPGFGEARGDKPGARRLAVTDTQFEKLKRDGMTRDIKSVDGKSGERDRYVTDYGDQVAELDAIDPKEMLALVKRAILKHLPQKRIDEMQAFGEDERGKI